LAGRGERAGGRYGTVKSAATQSSAAGTTVEGGEEGTTVEGGEEGMKRRIMEKIKKMSPIVAKVISQKYTKKGNASRAELDYVEPGEPSEAAGLPRYACQDLFDVNVDSPGAYATVLFCY